MSQPCGTCLGGPDCLPSNDLNLMSLDSTVFPFVPVCPPGLDCFGTSLGAGTISFPACNQVLTRSLPAGLSVADWLQVIGQMLAQVAQLAQFCGGDNPVTPINPTVPTFLYFNHPQSCSSFCPDGTPFTYAVSAGRVVALTQAAADAQAYALACALAVQNKICLSDIDDEFCSGVPLSINIFATGQLAGFPFSNFWEMVDGSLPTGVTFNGGYLTGGLATITGTPTSVGDFAFTIQVTTPAGSLQKKTYLITVESCATGLITLSVTPLTWNPGDAINYVGTAPTFPGDTFRIDWTATDWDGRGSSNTGHFSDVGSVFDGSGNATVNSLRLMRRILISSSGREYWGAGPCTLKIEDTDQSPSVSSNTLSRTLTRHTSVSVDGAVFAYIVAHPDPLTPVTYTGTLTQEFFNESGAGNVIKTQFEDTGIAIGGQTIVNSQGILYSPNGVDLVLAYEIAMGGGHATLTYTKLATSISAPTGVYTLLNDPNGDAPATCTIT